jgi:hypothetical protein
MSDTPIANGDWKSRVEADRRKLQEKLETEKAAEKEMALPPANFLTIISTFATQAMIALGEAALPGSKERVLDLESARFAIDALDVLHQKTKGNLDEYEERTLQDVLHGLQLRFVAKSKEPPAGKPGTGT